jgi:hypothetical protein
MCGDGRAGKEQRLGSKDNKVGVGADNRGAHIQCRSSKMGTRSWVAGSRSFPYIEDHLSPIRLITSSEKS